MTCLGNTAQFSTGEKIVDNSRFRPLLRENWTVVIVPLSTRQISGGGAPILIMPARMWKYTSPYSVSKLSRSQNLALWVLLFAFYKWANSAHVKRKKSAQDSIVNKWKIQEWSPVPLILWFPSDSPGRVHQLEEFMPQLGPGVYLMSPTTLLKVRVHEIGVDFLTPKGKVREQFPSVPWPQKIPGPIIPDSCLGPLRLFA